MKKKLIFITGSLLLLSYNLTFAQTTNTVEITEEDNTKVIIINNNNNNNNNNNANQNNENNSARSDLFGAKFALKQFLKEKSPYQNFNADTYNLSSFEKQILYKSLQKKGTFFLSLLNVVLLPIALGSFIHGDTLGGWLQVGLFWGGYILGVGGVSTIGVLAIGASFILGIVCPYFHANSYNNRLQKALYANQNHNILQNERLALITHTPNQMYKLEMPLFSVVF